MEEVKAYLEDKIELPKVKDIIREERSRLRIQRVEKGNIEILLQEEKLPAVMSGASFWDIEYDLYDLSFVHLTIIC